MAKKLVKKAVKAKKVPAAKSEASESVEMPMTSTLDADDVAEDHKVFDMSNIAAPIIEFELPNLTERKIVPSEVVETSEDVKKPEDVKTKKKAIQKTSQKSSGTKETLTAEKLNNELVKLRPFIIKSKNQLMPKLLRQKKKLETSKSPESQRKLARITEEVVGLKAFDKDSVAKFAALNMKTLNELKITDKTPVAERLLYKLAVQDVVVDQMAIVREKYTEWGKTAAFFMQRLGLQYANKVKKEAEDVAEDVEDSKDPEDVEDDVETSEEPEDVETPEDVTEYNDSDVEIADSDEESEKTAEKRRELLLGLIGVKEDKSRPKIQPKKRKISSGDSEDVTSSGKSMKLEMKEIFAKELKSKEVQKPKKTLKKAPVAPKAKRASEDVPEDVVEAPEDNGAQKTLVMKVDLKKGGKIQKLTSSVASAPKTTSPPEDVDSDDEESSFFLKSSQKTSTIQKTSKIQKTSSIQKTSTTQKTSNIQKTSRAPVSSKPAVLAEPVKKKGSSKNSGAPGAVHPSWAASQLKKKEMSAAKPCGKKITFGDDD